MTAGTLPSLLREQAATRPDATMLRVGDRTFSFAEMDRTVNRLVGGLRGLGVEPGDRVALLTTNRWEVVALFLACLRSGAIHVPLNAYLKGDFLRHQLVDAGASVLVGDDPGLRRVGNLDAALPDLRVLVALDETPRDVEAVAFRRLVEAEPRKVPPPDPGAPASIVYTSGTTGLPKGCVLPQGYFPNAAKLSRTMLGYTSDDMVLTALPLYHGWALGVVSAAVTHGLTAVIEEEFSPRAFRERWREIGATVVNGVGAMMVALLGLPPSPLDREHELRAVFSFPLDERQRGAFADRFGVEPFGQMFGQTETGAVTFSRLDEPADPSGIGRPSPAYEVRLVDDEGQVVPAGEVGEIVVRPRRDHVMYLGYWRDDAATAEARQDGWHHTGDLARKLSDGSLAFVDRKSDAVRRRGENVSSIEVERAITAHPAVAEAAVHAVPSAMTEDDLKACLVLEDGASVDPEDLFAFFAQRLPYYAVPRYVEVVDELPRTATMRVRKHELRDRGVTDATWDLEAMRLTVDRDARR